jgi:hypothetical protein
MFLEEWLNLPNFTQEQRNNTFFHIARHLKKGNKIIGICPSTVVLAGDPNRTEILAFWKQYLIDVWDRVVYKRPKKGTTLSLF